MLPVLFHVGGVAIGTHAFFVFLGLVAAVVIMVAEARRRDVRDPRLLWVVLGALFFGALAAKMSTAWRYIQVADAPSIQGVLVRGGKSVLGGLAGAYAGVLLVKRRLGWKTSTGDLFAPAVAAGMAIGRVGCFLTEQIGTPTSLPWGVRPTDATAARVPNCPACTTGVAMHPSFAYEVVFNAVMVGVLVWLRPRIRTQGALFKIYLAAYAGFRFLVEFVRGNEVVWGGLSGSQLFLIPSMLMLAAYFLRQGLGGDGPKAVPTTAHMPAVQTEVVDARR